MVLLLTLGDRVSVFPVVVGETRSSIAATCFGGFARRIVDVHGGSSSFGNKLLFVQGSDDFVVS